MTIKNKLASILFVLVGSFAVSVLVYFAVLSPVDKMNAEKDSIGSLRDALNAQIHNAALITIVPSFSDAAAAYAASDQATRKAFETVKDLKILPKSGKQIVNSLAVIQRLSALIESNSDLMLTRIEDLDLLLKEEGEDYQIQFLAAAQGKGIENVDPVLVGFATHSLTTAVYNLNSTIVAALNAINKQNGLIADQIEKIRSRSAIIAVSSIVAFIGLVLLLSLRITRGISLSILRIKGGVAAFKDGDLTAAFAARRADEIGALSADMDTFAGALRDSIAKAQAASSENIEIGDSLASIAGESSSSSTQIDASTSLIQRRISTLNESIGGAAASVRAIADSIARLKSQSQEQLAMVEESSASVTEMIASVDSVARITELRRQAAEGLVSTVSSGGDKMRGAFDVVKKINESVGSIKDITGIIAGISSKTNLLAMNAAIEAAHAGEAGKGFSVVADEIRSLAEASAVNSKEISAILKQIVALIGEATKAGGETDQAFAAIDREVKELRASLGEISASMGELRTGGKQILEAMTVLSDASIKTHDASAEIDGNSESIRGAMESLKRISDEVDSGMAEIAAGIKEISTASASVLDNAEKLESVGRSLNEELSRFKTA